MASGGECRKPLPSGGEGKAHAPSPRHQQFHAAMWTSERNWRPPHPVPAPSRGVPSKANSEGREKRSGRIPAAFRNRSGPTQASAQMPRKGKLASIRTVAGISRTMPSSTNCVIDIALSGGSGGGINDRGRSHPTRIHWEVGKTSTRCRPIQAAYSDPSSRERRGSWSQISLRARVYRKETANTKSASTRFATRQKY